MRTGRLLLGRYVVGSIAPYLLLTFVILTAVLLTQQAGKMAEALGAARASLSFALELLLGVLPGIVLFTLPMAVLIGTATGFARMGSDSELVVFRASGLSNWRLTLPPLALGLACALFTVFDAFVVAPAATRSARQAALRATIERLETPIQPGTFNTQLPGKLIYVREGDEASGEWRKVFIHWSEPGGDLRLVTARSGRIDLTGDQTELVLHDAMVTTLPSSPPSGRVAATAQRAVVTEKSEQLRVRLSTGRSALLSQLARAEDYEEMGWAALLESWRSGPINKRRELLSSVHKRMALAMTPLPFVLLGVGLGGRARKGGRAFGAVLAVASMIIFYLAFLGGDYLSRTGTVSPFVGAWFATLLALAAGVILVSLGANKSYSLLPVKKLSGRRAAAPRRGGEGSGATTLRQISFLGLLDRSIIGTLIWYFALALLGLVGVFLIFTFFETLRFVAADGSRSRVVTLYLLYLSPLAATSVAPVATLISILVTYALMARRSEAISWWSSGQSLYRLALPSLWFVCGVCALLWLVQERVLPGANVRQEELRSRLRSGPVRADTASGYLWLAASARKLYSYKYDAETGAVKEPTLYEFDPEGVFLEGVVWGNVAEQSLEGGGVALESASYLKILPAKAWEGTKASGDVFTDEATRFQLFKPELKKLTEYSTDELSKHLKNAVAHGAGREQIAYLTIALWRRRLDPLSPAVMWINGLPLALAFGRKSAMMPLLIAIATGVLYWLGANLFSQIGAYGLLPPQAAVCALPLLFALTGTYFFSRAKT
ncbi:MAG TPA: LptF/LptG family permease [Pyrinomonadaceae bacterium]|jgi:lipopolysaccharide export LptBFGC system permease protein LptF